MLVAMKEGLNLKVRVPEKPLRTKEQLLILFINLNSLLLRRIIRSYKWTDTYVCFLLLNTLGRIFWNLNNIYYVDAIMVCLDGYIIELT